MSDKKKKLSSIELGAINSDLIQKHGEGASQILQAFKGKRFDSSGKDLGHQGRSLDEISKYKLNENPVYKENNIKQQAGFSAELIHESRTNKEAILNNSDVRMRTTDGVGDTNNQRYDHELFVDGKKIPNSGTQMKIYSDPKNLVNEFKNGKFEKYLDSPINVPPEQLETIKELARKNREEYLKEAQRCRDNGKIDEYNKYLKQADNMKKLEDKVQESKVTLNEARDARLNPKVFTSKEILKDSNKAGLQAAKGAALLSAGISIAQNTYSFLNGDKDLDEACCDVGKDVAISGASAYFIAGGGTALKAFMHSSKREIVRKVGTTNAPGMIVVAAIEIGKSLKKYASGEIDEIELLHEFGEKGTGMIGSSYGAALGTAVFPGVGTVIGGMIGYTVSGIFYKEAVKALNSKNISKERREVIEKFCNEAISKMQEYKFYLISENNKILEDRDLIITELEQAIYSDDSVLLGKTINNLGASYGYKLQFESFEEFDNFMNDDNTKIIL